MSDSPRFSVPFLGAVLVAGSAAVADELTIEQFRLECGARITIVHVPDAPRQVIQTWLPIGSMREPAGHPQIAEIAVGTLLSLLDDPDPDAGPYWFTVPGAEETTVHSWSPPAGWRSLLAVHWALFEPVSLDKQRLEQRLDSARHMRGVEERSNSLGVMYWYRVSAWNQVARHKQQTITLFAPLTDESFADIRDWLRPRLGLNEHVDIAAIGPVDPVLVREAIEEQFGRLPRIAPAHDFAVEGDAHDRVESRWSQSDRLVMHWRALPDDAPASRALADLVRFNIRGLQMPAEQAGSYGSVDLGGGRVYLVTGSLNAATDFEQVLSEIEARFHALREPPAGMVREIMSAAADQAQLHEWPPDFAPLRMEPPHGTGESAEWDWLSAFIGAARRLGVEPLQVSGIYRDITPEDAEAFCTALAEAPAQIAVIHPEQE